MSKSGSIGFSGPVAAVVVVVVLLVRLATIGSVNDADLEAAIRAELANELGIPAVEAAQQMLETGEGDFADVAAMVDRQNIRVDSVSVSKPLFSIGSTEKAIVHFAYQLPGQAERKTYWRFRHSTLGGWRYYGRSSVVSYYLNFF